MEGEFQCWLEVVEGPVGHEVIVHASGELDIATTPALAAALREASEHPAAHVILDLRELAFLDATGLGCLVQAKRELGLSLYLRAPSPPVRRLLELAGLTVQFQYDEQLEAAHQRLVFVQTVWQALQQGGPAALEGLVSEEVEWRLLGPETRIARGIEGLEELSQTFVWRGAGEVDVVAVGEHVLVHQEAVPAEPSGRELWSLHLFRRHRLATVIMFTTEQRADDVSSSA